MYTTCKCMCIYIYIHIYIYILERLVASQCTQHLRSLISWKLLNPWFKERWLKGPWPTDESPLPCSKWGRSLFQMAASHENPSHRGLSWATPRLQVEEGVNLLEHVILNRLVWYSQNFFLFVQDVCREKASTVRLHQVRFPDWLHRSMIWHGIRRTVSIKASGQ